MFGDLFHTVLFQPIFNLLVFTYNALPIPSLGLAIIVITLIIKFVLFPLSKKAYESQIKLKQIQPKIKEIQDKYEDDQEKMSQEMMSLYRDEGVNPLGGCLPILVQLPILFALFRVFQSDFSEEIPGVLYSFVSDPGSIHHIFFGVNLFETSLILALGVGLLQFVQTRMMSSSASSGGGSGIASKITGQMSFVMPVITFIIALQLPAALPIYWLVNILFTIGQQKWLEQKLS